MESPSPPASVPRRARWWVVAAIVVLPLVVLALLFDLNWFKAPLERRVEAATGRAFAIDGALDGHFGWPPRFSAEQVRLGNLPGAEPAAMLRIERIELSLWPWRALRGRWHLDDATLVAPRLHLQRDAAGNANWDGLLGDDDGGGDLRVDRLRISDGRVQFRDVAEDSDLQLQFATERDVDDSGTHPLRVRGDGRYRGEPFELDGRIASPLRMRSGSAPYAIDLQARAGATRVLARGELLLQLPPEALDLEFTLSGDNLADVEPLFGIALPETPPYRFAGQLVLGEGRWRYTGFEGTVGDSDLRGEASIGRRDGRLLLRADLHSNRLHIDDLAGVLGGVPEPDGTVSAAQRREAARRAELGRIFPDRPVPPGALRRIDADVRLTADGIQPRRWPLESMQVTVQARDGIVRVDPLHFASADGTIDAVVEIDAREDPLRFDATASGRGLSVPVLFPDADFARGARGRIGGQLTLRGHGASVADMLASADGELGLLMGRGRIRGAGDGEGFDLADAAGFVSDDGEWMTIRCAWAELAIEDGVARPRELAIDAAETVILGEGSISLADERWALTLDPQPKRARFPALRTPVSVVGPLHRPEVDTDVGALLRRGAAAGLLYALAPPAALLSVVGTGPGDDTDCGRDAGGQRQARAGGGDEADAAGGSGGGSRAGDDPGADAGGDDADAAVARDDRRRDRTDRELAAEASEDADD